LPGVARRLVTFFCFAKKKVTQEKATPVYRPCGVPSIFHKQAGLRGKQVNSKNGVGTKCPQMNFVFVFVFEVAFEVAFEFDFRFYLPCSATE